MWKKGESGNPNGRPPKGEALTDILRSRLNKQDIADKLIQIGMEGDVSALKYIFDRLDGTPRQRVEMSNEKDAEWLDLVKDIYAEAYDQTTYDPEGVPEGPSENTDT